MIATGETKAEQNAKAEQGESKSEPKAAPKPKTQPWDGESKTVYIETLGSRIEKILAQMGEKTVYRTEMEGARAMADAIQRSVEGYAETLRAELEGVEVMWLYKSDASDLFQRDHEQLVEGALDPETGFDHDDLRTMFRYGASQVLERLAHQSKIEF